MTIRTEDLTAFVAAARNGTLVGAARIAGISKSVLTRRIARLESTLGASVFLRSTRGLKPTALGKKLLRHAHKLSQELEAIGQIAEATTHEVAGVLRITVPAAFSTPVLHRALARFIERFPEVQLDLRLDDRYVDLARREVDLALRVGAVRNTAHHTVRRLGMLQHVVVASDGYLQRAPPLASPRDLVHHRCLVHSGIGIAHQWRFLVNGRWTTPKLGGVVRVDAASMLVELAALGSGLAALPAFLARDGVRSGRLRVVLGAYALPRRGVFCVTPYRRPWPPAVLALTDQIVDVWTSCNAAEASGDQSRSSAGDSATLDGLQVGFDRPV